MEIGTRDDLKRGLDTLEGQGPLILVIGDADPVAQHRISSSLLGDQANGRHPVFVLVDQPDDIVANRVSNPDQIDADRILRYGDHTTSDTDNEKLSRATPTEEPAQNDKPEGDEPPKSHARGDLQQVTARLNDRIDAFAQTTVLEETDLRICLDSAVPLFDEHAIADVRTFFEDLRQLTRAQTGMTHVMYPVDVSADVATDTLGPFDEVLTRFDILIEIQSQNGRHEQRWTLLDSDCRTDWIELKATPATP